MSLRHILLTTFCGLLAGPLWADSIPMITLTEFDYSVPPSLAQDLPSFTYDLYIATVGGGILVMRDFAPGPRPPLGASPS